MYVCVCDHMKRYMIAYITSLNKMIRCEQTEEKILQQIFYISFEKKNTYVLSKYSKFFL